MPSWVRSCLAIGIACAAPLTAVGLVEPPSPRPPLASASAAPAAHFAETFDVSTFQKGNVHTHTTRSDGVDRPEDVIAWYRVHGYRFLALTDHNVRVAPSAYAALQDDEFRLLPGEEISMTGAGRQVHVNALCSRRTIGGGAFATAADALVWALSEVDAQGAIGLVNHPNFDRALSSDTIVSAPGASLLEIQSGHPYVFSDGIDGRPSHEALWDSVLTQGLAPMGVAVDDTHRVSSCGDPPAYPGAGWVEVFSASNREGELCEALRRGRLYASTGAELVRIRVERGSYTVWPRDAARVSFVSAQGTTLRTVDVEPGGMASYALRGDEPYVRSRIRTASGGAWTPAVVVRR
jgi:hypothetical protein